MPSQSSSCFLLPRSPRRSAGQLLALASNEIIEDLIADEHLDALARGFTEVNQIKESEEAWANAYGYHDEYNDFDLGPRTTLTEDSWVGKISGYDSDNQGVDYLRWLMEDVKACDIATKDIKWATTKFTLLCAVITGGFFNLSVIEDPSMILARYSVALEQVLRKNGIEYRVFTGITYAGWNRFKEITQQEEATAV